VKASKIVLWIHKKLIKLIGRNTSKIFYLAKKFYFIKKLFFFLTKKIKKKNEKKIYQQPFTESAKNFINSMI